MSQVIIVSNRLPVSVKKSKGKLHFSRSLGGLATGLSSYIRKDSKNRWIGWPGIASDDLTPADRQEIVDELAKRNCSPVFLTRREIDNFYNGYSNSVLWPQFHTLAKRRGSDGAERRRWWSSYQSVNRQFTQAALNMAESGDRVWVHDYQLTLVPGMLRSERNDLNIGFFLHIPFPGFKTFNALKESKTILRGMLGADVVGFHTTMYVDNFLESCQEAGLAQAESNMITLSDHTVQVGNFPMGIDYDKYAAAGKSKAVRTAVRKYRRRYKKLRVIVAVDRLDPSKGLVERLEAYRTFLELEPKLRGKIVFSMVAAPSRMGIASYRNLAKKLKALSDEINDEYGTPKWKPVDYMNTPVPFEEVTALYKIADVAFIAPLRDGMNLVAKEFIASKRKRGVLILSRTAGAAHELPDAVLVNPRNKQELVDALQQALTMRKRELRGRLKRMQQQLSGNTVQDWAKEFVEALHTPVPGTPKVTYMLRGRNRARLLRDYRKAEDRLLFLDYDGSLIPFTEDYKDTKPSQALIDLLKALGEDSRNDVVLISGRTAEELGPWFGDLPVNLVAEHGAAFKKADRKTWSTVEKVDTEWKKVLLPQLEKYAARTPKARVEIKPHSLVWHYRAASAYYAQKNTVTIKRVFKPLLKQYGLQMMQGNKALEIKNPRISKGAAAADWLERDYDFVFFVGDDVTDEELFKVLPPSAYSIKVGRGRTAARFRLFSINDVLKLLRTLSR
ncbi:MAG TPA: bifunctional alpha,alpha-trehalose-phosphate synthase (UDP-forming)/trehalose-phosphatase [Candidatus Saccharimonadales bacterium]|nr:bifunctional alpha,alpha-trehalose-phosphate synthase (UDP-forming)/trehalose-phosphatase [Candidatus Saccharimonadales bacterium]